MSIVMNGIYDPMQTTWNLFIALEIITVIIECIILSVFNRSQPKKKQWGWEDVLIVTIMMNISSAILGAMVWLNQ